MKLAANAVRPEEGLSKRSATKALIEGRPRFQPGATGWFAYGSFETPARQALRLLRTNGIFLEMEFA